MRELIIIILFLQLHAKILEERPQYVKLQLVQKLGTGYYNLQVFIGNPPQQQSLMVDTGSYLLTVKSQKCENCEKTQLPYFQQTKSTTFKGANCEGALNMYTCLALCPANYKNLRCDYNIGYGTLSYNSSILGFLGQDDIYFQKGNQEGKVSSKVACNTYESSTNVLRQNGLIGLSIIYGISFIFEWFASQDIMREDQRFSLCLQGKRGYFELGNFTEENQETAKVDYNYYSGAYRVEVDFISMNDQNLVNQTQVKKDGGVLIDSGSNSCVFPVFYFQKIMKIIDETCQALSCSKYDAKTEDAFYNQNNRRYYYLFNIPYLTDYEQYINEKFAEIRISMNGTSFNLKASSYLVYSTDTDDGRAWVSLAITPTKDNQTILGANWMNNKKIVFNLHESKPYLEIYESYMCFDYRAEMMEKIKGGLLGYSIILAVFLVIIGRQKVGQKCRGKNLKKEAKIPISETL